MQQHWIKLALLIGLTTFSTVGWTSQTYYRYKDKDGNEVMTSALPADVADQGGYEIISPRGNVIETVPPAKTKAEIAKEAEQAEKAQEAQKQAAIRKEEEAIQAKKDDILLKSFSDEKDIARSRDEKTASIEVLEEITKENLTRLQKQLDNAKASLQSYQTAHQKPPISVQKTIDETQRQIDENTAFLEHKKQEKLQLNKEYQALIDRFRVLKNHSAQQPAEATTPSAPTKSP